MSEKEDKIKSCVDSMMNSGKLGKTNPKTGKNFTKSDLFAICTSSQEGIKPMIKEKVIFKFSEAAPVVITETKKDGKVSKKVRGVALKARTSRNNVTYVMEEMEKSKASLIGRNIKINHSDDVTDNVAKITNSFIEGDELLYEAEVFNTKKHSDILEMIENGLIQHVSIEAIAGQMEKREDLMIARNLEFTGMAFVDTPGVPEATVALAEAWNKSEAKHGGDMEEPMSMKTCMMDMMKDGMDKDAAHQKCMSMMQKDKEGFEALYSEEAKIQKEKLEGEIMEEKLVKELIAEQLKTFEGKAESEALKKELESLKTDLSLVKEELKAKPKGVITSEDKKSSNLKKERSNKGMSFWCEEGLTNDESRLY